MSDTFGIKRECRTTGCTAYPWAGGLYCEKHAPTIESGGRRVKVVADPGCGDARYVFNSADLQKTEETPVHEYKAGDRVEVHVTDGLDGMTWMPGTLSALPDDQRIPLVAVTLDAGAGSVAYLKSHVRPIPCEACGKENACSDLRRKGMDTWTEELPVKPDTLVNVNLGPACWLRTGSELSGMIRARREAKAAGIVDIQAKMLPLADAAMHKLEPIADGSTLTGMIKRHDPAAAIRAHVTQTAHHEPGWAEQAVNRFGMGGLIDNPPEPTLAEFEALCAACFGDKDAPTGLPKGWRWIVDRREARPGGTWASPLPPAFIVTILDESNATIGTECYPITKPTGEIEEALDDLRTDCAEVFMSRSHSGPGRGGRR